MLYQQIAEALNGKGFTAAVDAMCKRLGFPADWLMCVMKSESGLSPKAYNAQGGATGLIQFMPTTAQWLGTTTAALIRMTGLQQLFYVEKYYKPFVGKIKQPSDLYLLTFYPFAMGQPDTYVFGTERSLAYGQMVGKVNQGFDINRDGLITLAEFRQFVNTHTFKDLK